MEIIKDADKIAAIIYRDDDWTEGLNFITPDNFFIQAGSWSYNKGKKLDSHLHKIYTRESNLTQEVVYVKKGSMKVLLFNGDKQKIKEIILCQGDLAVVAECGHGYEILEDGTQVLETKNGPFIGVELDKEKF